MALPTPANASLAPTDTGVVPLFLPVPIEIPNAPQFDAAGTVSESCFSTDPCNLLVGGELDPPHPIESLTWSYGSDIDVGEHFTYKMWTMFPGGTIQEVIFWYCIKSSSGVNCELRNYVGSYNSKWWSLQTQSLNEGNQWPEGSVGFDVTYQDGSGILAE